MSNVLIGSDKKIIQWQIERNLHLQPVNHKNELQNILEEIFEILGYESYKDKNGNTINVPRQMADNILSEYYDAKRIDPLKVVDGLNDIRVYGIGYQLKMGFNPEETIEETIKEINDRTGSYNPKEGKWIKEQTKENTYKADYSKCIITNNIKGQ